MIEQLLPILQTCLAIGNLIIMLWALKKFLGKPHDTLEEQHKVLAKRVDAHDVKIEDIEEALRKGNDKFREQSETNNAFREIMLAFVDFEIAYCIHTGYEHSEDLKRAKETLEKHLARK